jgi:hypothetical protein
MTTTATDDAARAPRIGRYQLDRQGSTVTFKSRHLFGLAPVASKRLARSEGRWTLTGTLRILGVRR